MDKTQRATAIGLVVALTTISVDIGASLIRMWSLGKILDAYETVPLSIQQKGKQPPEGPKDTALAAARREKSSRGLVHLPASPDIGSSPIDQMMSEPPPLTPLENADASLLNNETISGPASALNQDVDDDDDPLSDFDDAQDRALERRDSSQGDDHGMTCLHFFALTNRPPSDLLSIMQDSTLPPSFKPDINAKIRHLHLTALHFAAMNASLEFIKTLVENCNAHVDAQDILGKTPLRLAATLRRVEIVNYLLLRGAKDLADRDGISALRHGIYRGDVDVVALFLEQRPNVINQVIAVGGTGERETTLLPLHVAASFGRVEMIKLLIRYGAEANTGDAYERTPLMYAATKGKTDALLALLDKAENEDEFAGDQSGDRALVKQMNIDKADSQGWTALHYAAAATKGDPVSSVRTLLEIGQASPDPREFKYFLTPLHMASKSGSVEVVQELLKHGADPKARTSDRRTAAHFAAYGGHALCLAALLRCEPGLVKGGEELAGESGERITPLHLAIRGQKKEAAEVVKVLVENGADVTAPIKLEVERSRIGLTGAWRRFSVWVSGPKKDNGTSTVKSVSHYTFLLTPICFAIASGHLDSAILMLKSRKMVYLSPFQYFMSMGIAASLGRPDIAWLLTIRTMVGLCTLTLMVLSFVWTFLHLLVKMDDRSSSA
ncbi:ankyrin repeat-containing domain protein [Chytridium lagenaria]|nr:ankyrin repeat-containing domain protein [Chytridium lagenaria]